MQAIVMQFIIISLSAQYVNNFSQFFQIILTFYQNTNIMDLSIYIFKRIFLFHVQKSGKTEVLRKQAGIPARNCPEWTISHGIK